MVLKFGTDGIRGRMFGEDMNPSVCLNISLAFISVLKENANLTSVSGRGKILVARDTRSSSLPIYHAVVSGIVSAGFDVLDCEVIHVGALSRLTTIYQCSGGIMISASHNPYYDNGLKLFGSDGCKISKEVKLEILNNLHDIPRLMNSLDVDKIGRIENATSACIDYIDYITSVFRVRDVNLNGLKVVIDCANGAAIDISHALFVVFGAEIIFVGDQPNGVNINADCGAISPQLVSDKVRECGADIGFCFDGDGDRIVVIDSDGRTVSGEQLIACLAIRLRESRLYPVKYPVVTTIASNSSLQKFLLDKEIDVTISDVGDQNVYNTMIESGGNLGGEESGHIILKDITSVGDGPLVGLLILLLINALEDGFSINDLFRYPHLVPCVKRNIAYNGVLGNDIVPKLSKISSDLSNQYSSRSVHPVKILLRASGTERKIRVCIESTDESVLSDVIDDIRERVGLIVDIV